MTRLRSFAARGGSAALTVLTFSKFCALPSEAGVRGDAYYETKNPEDNTVLENIVKKRSLTSESENSMRGETIPSRRRRNTYEDA